MVHPTEQDQHRLQIGAQRDHGVGEKPVPQGGGERERDEGVGAETPARPANGITTPRHTGSSRDTKMPYPPWRSYSRSMCAMVRSESSRRPSLPRNAGRP